MPGPDSWRIMAFDGATVEITLIGKVYCAYSRTPPGSVGGLARGLADLRTQHNASDQFNRHWQFSGFSARERPDCGTTTLQRCAAEAGA